MLSKDMYSLKLCPSSRRCAEKRLQIITNNETNSTVLTPSFATTDRYTKAIYIKNIIKISCSIFRVYFVSLLFRMLMYFFTFCMFSRVVCKFPLVYICVIPSCSFSASLSSGTLLTSWFSEPRCQHFGIYLPPMESQIHLLVSTN